MAALGAAVLVIGGGAVAVGVGSAPKPQKIIGCYDKATGDLRIVKKAWKCHDDEKVLRWNKRGPRGFTGADGADGMPGAPGAPGIDGATILTGGGAPADDLGADGDYYVDTDAGQLFGPKADGSWPEHGTSLRGSTGPRGPAGVPGDPGPAGPVGPPGSAGPAGPAGADGDDGADGADGNTILNGTAAPGAGAGANGDFYLDTTMFVLYGPKTAAGWGTGTSIRGDKGEKGDKGDPGEKGDKGDKGDPGVANVYSSSSGVDPAVVTTMGGIGAGQALIMPLSGTASHPNFLAVDSVDLTTSGGLAQVIPADTTVTSIAARLSTTVSLSLDFVTASIRAQLYTGSTNSNTLAAVPGAVCTMTLTDVVPNGHVAACSSTALNAQLTAGTTAVFVVSAQSSLGTLFPVTGFFSVSMTTS